MQNNVLAIAIPTFNRPGVLKENILAMLPELRLHRIPVYISDDSSNDDTEHLAAELVAGYEHLHYKRNRPGFGHDRNFFETTALPDCKYVWYLGDSLLFKPGFLQEILDILEGDFDFVFMNSYTQDTSCGKVASPHEFLLERTWYLTLTGATIYGKRPLAMLLSADRKAEWKNFPQLGMILEYCTRAQAQMYWYGKSVLAFNKKKSQSYWMKSALDVFVRDWSNFIGSFPGLFSPAEMARVIRSHAVNTHLFSLKNLLIIRAGGGVSLRALAKHRSQFVIASPTPTVCAVLIALIPAQLITGVANVVRAAKRLWRRPADVA